MYAARCQVGYVLMQVTPRNELPGVEILYGCKHGTELLTNSDLPPGDGGVMWG